MPGFDGFGPRALAFFTALEFHQTKAWFDENRALYESDVVAPMTALLDDLTAVFAKKKIPLRADGKRSIFRIHRDVRFARDKRPYKTHCGAVMTRSGAKRDAGLLYIHIDPRGSFVAAGFHQPDPGELARLRAAIAGDGKKFAALARRLREGGLEMDSGTRLVRLPRGFEAYRESPVADALRLKSFIVREDVAAEAIGRPDFSASVAGFAGRALPLLRFGWASLE